MSARFASICLVLALPSALPAQTPPQVIHLWPNGAPGFESRKDEPEQARDYWVRNVHNPSVTVFLPPKEKANGCAVVVAPGGGFRELVYNAEGKQAAEFFNELGVAAFVLKYRLPNADHAYTLENVRQDAYRAMRLVRSRAAEFAIDPNRIGLLGFSAGGVLAKLVAFAPGDGNPDAFSPIDRVNGRPNFVMYVYPGKEEAPATIPADAPPAFLVCANDDEYGCDLATLELLVKYRAAKVPVEAHLLARGKHAFNMGDRSNLAAVRGWPQRMADWMSDSGLLKPHSGS